jgi:hypothetical protein
MHYPVSSVEALNWLVEAAQKAGHAAEVIPYPPGYGKPEPLYHRSIQVDGEVRTVHILTYVRRQRGRKAEYVGTQLQRATLKDAPKHMFYLCPSGYEPALLDIPSADLERAFFAGSAEYRTIYIRPDGKSTRIFPFWDYRLDWPVRGPPTAA